MNHKSLSLSLLLLCSPVFSAPATIPAKELSSLLNTSLDNGFFYQSFHFLSNNQQNRYEYDGHSNFYRTGISEVPLINRVTSGIHVSVIDTDLDSQTRIAGFEFDNHVKIVNHGLDGELRYYFTPLVSAQIFGGFGQNTYQNRLTAQNENITPVNNFSRYSGNNQFGGVRMNLAKRFSRWIASGRLTYFASRFHQNAYDTSFIGTLPVNALTVNLNTFVEHASLFYYHNEHVIPFVQGELLQVASRRINRPLFNDVLAINALPQATLDNNGYAIGAGVVWRYQKLLLTTAYQYSARGSTFSSNQFIANFKVYL